MPVRSGSMRVPDISVPDWNKLYPANKIMQRDLSAALWTKKKHINFKKQQVENKTFEQKIDFNIASLQQLQQIPGIGKVLSQRIINYRNKFDGGFIADIQLQDIYGISPEVEERLLRQFTVKTPRKIKPINLNSATVEQLVTVQYIDYELAYEIINQRTISKGLILLMI